MGSVVRQCQAEHSSGKNGTDRGLSVADKDYVPKQLNT